MVALLFNTVTLPASVGVALRSVPRCVVSSVKFAWRAHTLHALRWSASETVFGMVSFPQLTWLLRLRPAESSRVRVRALPLRLSASSLGLGLYRHPPPPNNSFKPTPCRGIGHVLYATLAHVRRPATGRLNSGVRRQKSVWWLCFSTRGLYRLRLVLLFGLLPAALLLRSGPSGALKPFTRYVGRLRKQ